MGCCFAHEYSLKEAFDDYQAKDRTTYRLGNRLYYSHLFWGVRSAPSIDFFLEATGQRAL